MNKLDALGKFGVAGGVAAAFVSGCASFGEPEVQWTPPNAGSTWTMTQHNTGSYGKDVQFDVTRGETVWQGKPAVTFANSVTGMTIMAVPDTGKWMALVGRDAKPLVTYDPPIGFQWPLRVGKEWSTTHRITVAATGKTSDFVFACKVEAREPVAVSAGTFNAFRIACKGPGYEEMYWSSVDYGIFLKTDLRRFPDHAQGAGSQQAELVALKVAK